MNKALAVFDIENLPNFWQVKFLLPASGQVLNYMLYPGSGPLDIASIMQVIATHQLVGFNSINYDMPILTLALYGATHEQLKIANDDIIVRNTQWWDFYRKYQIEPPQGLDHVDIFQVGPGVQIGLKAYGGRIHAPAIVDILTDFDKPVEPGERLAISNYCDNDLNTTLELYSHLRSRIALREATGERYGIDLRSKSDAQIAEAVIKAQLAFIPDRRYIPHGYTFKYDVPSYIKFVTPSLCQLLNDITVADFMVSDKDEAHALGEFEVTRTGVQIPTSLKNKNIRIGGNNYRLGIGGLHSQEQSVSYERPLTDVDVKSYYPSLILSLGMYPDQLGESFLKIYRNIYTRRLEAKRDATKLYDLGLIEDSRSAQTESDGLKITLNGTFGKLFSRYSVLYAPELGIRVTITGQLAMLMLIEIMELTGIPVRSANTDGIVLDIPPGYEQLARSNVRWWEARTGLETEETHYRALYSRDVNNYLAVTTDGKVKRKGLFAPGGIAKNPDKDIVADSVIAYLIDGIPVEQTIRSCTDIRKFLTLRACKGGAIDLPTGVAIVDGKYLGRHVRFYHSMRHGYIGTRGTGNKVAGTDGCTPIQVLPLLLPPDVNHQYYIDQAYQLLKDIGK